MHAHLGAGNKDVPMALCLLLLFLWLNPEPLVLQFGNEDKVAARMAKGNSFLTMPELGGLPAFDCNDAAGLSSRWEKWLCAFKLFAEGRWVTEAVQLKALLLHSTCMRVQDIYFTLPVVEGDANVFEKAVTDLNTYFSNVPYEPNMFRAMSQGPEETIEQYIT